MNAANSWRGLVGTIAATIVACATIGGVIGGDPTIIIEIVGATTFSLWAIIVVGEVVRARRVAATFERLATPAVLHGVPCRIAPLLGTDAVVVGVIWPTIYIGAALIHALTGDELQAVLFHEDHHRRSRAPLRAAALVGWMRMFGRSPAVGGVLRDRLADLETLADSHAMQRGSSASSLARALLKGEQLSVAPASFSYAADRRIGSLLEHAAGRQRSNSLRLPYEWVPLVTIAVTAVGCHLGL